MIGEAVHWLLIVLLPKTTSYCIQKHIPYQKQRSPRSTADVIIITWSILREATVLELGCSCTMVIKINIYLYICEMSGCDKFDVSAYCVEVWWGDTYVDVVFFVGLVELYKAYVLPQCSFVLNKNRWHLFLSMLTKIYILKASYIFFSAPNRPFTLNKTNLYF